MKCDILFQNFLFKFVNLCRYAAGPQARNLQLHTSALLKRLSRRLSRPPHSAPPLGPNLAAEALCASSTVGGCTSSIQLMTHSA
jgi:hypothetical protein